MRTNQIFVCGLITILIALAFTACDSGTDPGGTHTHSYNATWTYNSTQHWHACSCGDKIDVESHVGDPCAVCGYSSGALTLTGITAVYSSNNPIYPDTTLVTLKNGLTVTAVYNNNSTVTLTPADYILSGTLATGNSIITVIYQGKTTTFTVTVNAAHAHDWGAWTRTTVPTCTAPGMETRTCATPLSHTEERETAIDPVAHDWGNWVVTIPAAATSGGVDIRTCNHNTAHTEMRNTSPTGESGHIHQWGAYTVTTPAVCTADGVETRVCSLDATHIENRSVPAPGHNWGAWTQTSTTTCTEDGIETRICSRDSSHNETRPSAAAIGHNWGMWIQTTAPTQTVNGIETRTCSNDPSHKETRVVSMTGDSSHNHIWGAWTLETAPTCATAGENKRVCIIDSSHIETTPLDPLGHNYGAWSQIAAPTCTAAGVDVRTCSNNTAHTETRSGAIDPNAHDWNTAYTIISAVSETTDGIEVITCKHSSSHTKDPRTFYATGTAGLSFQLISGNTAYRVSKGTATGVTIHIPAYYRPNAASNYLPVTQISNGYDSSGNNAFGGTTGVPTNRPVDRPNTTLTSVTFAENSQLKTIGAYAFYYCTSLTSITIPASVTSIGSYAFYNCNLTGITIPAGVTSIGDRAFAYCKSLTGITIPAGVTSISDGAFSNCTNLTSVTFAEDSQLKTIGAYAFYYCTSLTSILTIPAGVTSIGDHAFDHCSSLIGSLTIPAGVTTIGIYAFAYCTGFTDITIPAGVTTIGSSAFYVWTAAQTINVQGKANQAAADAAWGSTVNNWRYRCNATIRYGQ